MSNEPRHGPVTMHRAVERAMMKSIRSRPADAPRAAAAPAPESGDEGTAGGDRAADANRAVRRDVAVTRGGRTGKTPPRPGAKRDPVR